MKLLWRLLSAVLMRCGPSCKPFIPVHGPLGPLPDLSSRPDPTVWMTLALSQSVMRISLLHWFDVTYLNFGSSAFSLYARVCLPDLSVSHSLWCSFLHMLEGLPVSLQNRQGISYLTDTSHFSSCWSLSLGCTSSCPSFMVMVLLLCWYCNSLWLSGNIKWLSRYMIILPHLFCRHRLSFFWTIFPFSACMLCLLPTFCFPFSVAHLGYWQCVSAFFEFVFS